jgi:hypothetical protein
MKHCNVIKLLLLQKKAVDDDIECRRDSDQHKWCRGTTVTSEEKMMSNIYIAYPEERSVTTRERVGW